MSKRKATAKGHADGDVTPTDHGDTQKAYLVSGEGTDEDVRQRCLDDIPGFVDMTARVQDELVRLMRKFWEMPVPPRFEVVQTDSSTVIRAPDDTNVTLSTMRTIETFASGSPELTNRRIEDLTSAARARKDLSSDTLMSDLAFITGGGAQDSVQSALLTQMTSTHSAALKALNLSMRAEYVDQMTQAGNLANRLLNTFTRQAEVLAKLQRGGEQVVKHIHIDNRHGGQAVVTDTVQTGGSNFETSERAHTTSAGTTMRSADANGSVLSIEAGARPQALPNAWLCAGLGSEARK